MNSAVLERKVLQTGDTVFQEGDAGDQAYIVQSGAVEIVKAKGDDQMTLGVVEKGAIFGEMALVDDQPRMATARTLEPTTLIIVSRSTFQRKLSKSDPFIRGLLGIMVQNIRSLTNERIAD
jgi:CRP-like cAMP-binding protein